MGEGEGVRVALTRVIHRNKEFPIYLLTSLRKDDLRGFPVPHDITLLELTNQVAHKIAQLWTES